MDPSDAPHLLRYLLRQDAVETRAWLTRAWAGAEIVPEDFNWLGLAEAATFTAQEGNDLMWAQVAVAVYDHLASGSAMGNGSGYANSAMHLRAVMIRRFGPCDGDPVLDVHRLVQWIRDSLTLPSHEAVRRATAWRDADMEEQLRRIDDVRQLRAIKNRLAVLELVAAPGPFHPPADVQLWLDVRHLLP